MASSIALLYITAPQLLAACILISLPKLRGVCECKRCWLALVIGGSWFGTLIFALLLSWLEQYRISVFGFAHRAIYPMLALGIFLVIRRYCKLPRQLASLTGTEMLQGLAAIVSIACIAVAWSQHFPLPAMSWDALDYWLHFSRELYLHDVGEKYENIWSLGGRAGRHPNTLIYLLAYFQSITVEYGATWVTQVWYMNTYISLVIVMFLAGSCLLNSALLGAICAYITATIPLLENHVYLYGYAELVMSACFGLQFILVRLLDQRFSVKLAVFFLICVIMLTIKNSSWVYVAIMVATMTILCVNERIVKPRMKLRLFQISIIGFLSLLAIWQLHSTEILEAVSQVLLRSAHTESGGSPLVILSDHIKAQIFNTSFSVTLIMVLIVSLGVGPWKERSFASRYVSIVFWCCFIVVTSMPFFSQYAYMTATYGNDTGGSRLLLPVMFSGVVATIVMLSDCMKCDENIVAADP